MFKSLQRQLTLSHLLVTVVSVFLLALLLLAGVIIHSATPLAARWARDVALEYAEDIAAISNQRQQPVDAFIKTYLANNVYEITTSSPEAADGSPEAEYLDFSNPEWGDWLLVLSPGGCVVASNYKEAYPVGQQFRDGTAPGFRRAWLEYEKSRAGVAQPQRWARHLNSRGKYPVGFAPILGSQNTLLGWVYFRSHTYLALAEMLTGLGTAILGAALTATFVSGLVGRQLARSFGRRLQGVSQASADFASGHLSKRVNVKGQDEIAQLGRQFNRMADRIGRQMRELRQLAEENAKLSEEAATLVKLEERHRLARDLHDGIKQQLFSLHLVAGATLPLLQRQPDRTEARLRSIAQTSHDLAVEMEHIIGQLRPASLVC